MRRTRNTEKRLLIAREFTKTLARNEPDVKPADAYRRLESWRQDKVARGVVNSDNDLYQIPEIQHFRRWFKADLKNSDLNYELKQMLKHKRNAKIELKDNKICIYIDLGDE
jgi:Fe2+ or Zn2+ uptake regulation protein|tara:strand:+ start:117 stop:449 length:333 start_codon:yes stop_codon:yes gene_type:complete